MPPDDIRREHAFTPGMKRRGVVRVLKKALQDAQREQGDRVVGVFGLLVMESGGVQLLSAISADELAKVIEAVPGALHRVASSMTRDPNEVGN